MLDEAPGAETLAHDDATEKSNLKAFYLAEGPADEPVEPDTDSDDKRWDDIEESGLQAYLGKKKYGEEGMKALQKAGREGASKEKMAKIRAKHDKLDEVEMDEGLDADQKRVGQLGPTEKVKNNNIGKLVGASESREFDDIKRLAGLK
jgi:hypothetical protein